MLLKIQMDNDCPIYQQLIDQIKAQIADGTLEKNDRLPSVRELAKDLGVNVNTIYKAYRELEVQGIVQMRMGSGATVIARRQEYLKRSERETMINDMVEHLCVEAYHLGFDEDYIIDLLDQRRKERAG